MAQLLIRGLEPEVVERLKERARQNNRSLEAEAREAIRTRAEQPTEAEIGNATMAFAQWARRMRHELEGRWTEDSTQVIRGDREGR